MTHQEQFNPTGSVELRSEPSVAPIASLRHLKIGWWMLVTFVSLGMLLEVMHGFKVDLYLSVERSGTRTVWTLAHAVGAILGLVHIAYAASLFMLPDGKASGVPLTSGCLNCASILLPAALITAGLVPSENTVPLGYLLAVPGLFFLLLSLLMMARRMTDPGGSTNQGSEPRSLAGRDRAANTELRPPVK